MATEEERVERIEFIKRQVEVVLRKVSPVPEADDELEVSAENDETGEFVIRLKSPIRDQVYRFDPEKRDWLLSEGHMVH